MCVCVCIPDGSRVDKGATNQWIINILVTLGPLLPRLINNLWGRRLIFNFWRTHLKEGSSPWNERYLIVWRSYCIAQRKAWPPHTTITTVLYSRADVGKDSILLTLFADLSFWGIRHVTFPLVEILSFPDFLKLLGNRKNRYQWLFFRHHTNMFRWG